MPFRTQSPVPPLGDLEIAVMEELWDNPDLSVKEMHDRIGVVRGISLNTVQSTMDRLFRKDLLSRTKQAHAFRYVPAVTREALVGNLINEVVGRFGGQDDVTVSAFMEATESWDDEQLDLLEKTLRERRAKGGTQ